MTKQAYRLANAVLIDLKILFSEFADRVAPSALDGGVQHDKTDVHSELVWFRFRLLRNNAAIAP
jgi:hypothetical protein